MREYETLTSLEAVNAFVDRYPLSFVYVSSTDCSVCHALFPKVQDLLMKYPEIHLGNVNAQEVQEVAGALSIFTVPVLLLFVEGKEYLREARIVHLDLLDEKIKRIYDLVVVS
ncbi:thioredoxin family protein [Paenibacillus sp. 1001270B_150601_E10]|uniref:thioredoxin family protein n=1 Tax=Paenibacillus sp. 1001270B_150601_E10 TaxID=2787079 RepID=UPI00189DED0E|nr:thioredoxin family protein [Paenibacillus sp. 1001270B_150601_E10]